MTPSAATIMAFRSTAVIAIHVGSGLRRSRFSRPISRRLTNVMAKMVKQAAMTP